MYLQCWCTPSLFTIHVYLYAMQRWWTCGTCVVSTREPSCMMPRVHNKRREGEYPTLTVPCTNTLYKVRAIKHWVLLLCFKVTKDLMTGANSFVVLHVQISISYHSRAEVYPARNTQMNSTAGHSWCSNNLHTFQFCLKYLTGSNASLVLFHTIVSGWFAEIRFGNSRADSEISKFMHS